jgi:hypothetical protein
VGPLERRVRKLEEVRQSRHIPGTGEDLQERRAALRESLQRGWEKAEREEAAGDSRRLHAMEDLQRRMQERVEQRRRDES